MKKERRWMKWVIAESAKEQPALPWTRASRNARRDAGKSGKAARA
ncbi:hypothetical protein [Rhodovulum sp. FJ3]|jgi:hypothetical protein|nr:hypothetical protein [Rhodovulum sp. FJ3]MDV4167064.1 hypothetical protein [Rhodovulum sp. FJ3]MEC8630018.1 hypothetical protein [Pseudomonadota bacterium]|tara:strand:- start:68 stop:202 length:135 start_codon:yes stop_codon:yes gene_type:complete